MRSAELLIKHLLSNPDNSESDGVAFDLLTAYQRGSPIESLRILLSSVDDRLVGEGVWIASELPEQGKPLIVDVGRLLGHRSKKVRFWAIDCVLLWADSSNGCQLAAAVALIDDAERAVRWKAMCFLAMASREQLQAALSELSTTNPESPYAYELKWLLDQERRPVQVMAGLRSKYTRRRKTAAVAASRIAGKDSGPLHEATSTGDAEIAEFARDMLERIAWKPGGIRSAPRRA